MADELPIDLVDPLRDLADPPRDPVRECVPMSTLMPVPRESANETLVLLLAKFEPVVTVVAMELATLADED